MMEELEAYLDEVVREAAVHSLYTVVKDHRAVCPGEDCTVTLSLLLPLFERLVGRTATDDELSVFV